MNRVRTQTAAYSVTTDHADPTDHADHVDPTGHTGRVGDAALAMSMGRS